MVFHGDSISSNLELLLNDFSFYVMDICCLYCLLFLFCAIVLKVVKLQVFFRERRYIWKKHKKHSSYPPLLRRAICPFNYTHIRTKCFAIAATVLFVLFQRNFQETTLVRIKWPLANSNVVCHKVSARATCAIWAICGDLDRDVIWTCYLRDLCDLWWVK